MGEKYCEHCYDGENGCIYPMYGVAPHSHNMGLIGSIIGSTVLDDKKRWPENFIEDEEARGCGTYTHCLKCGNPR